MIVSKSIRMAGMLSAPVIGLVENMRTLVCPCCGETVRLFDDGSAPSGGAPSGGAPAGTPAAGKHGSGVAGRLGLPLVASLPWRKEVAQARCLRWKELPGEARRDADRIADEVELATVSAPAPEAAAAADRQDGHGECGCECGTSDCCADCREAGDAAPRE